MINNKFYSIYIFLLIIGLFSFNFISAGLRTSSNTYTSNTINMINNDTELFHNNLTGIQGGVADQYYHIRQSWYDDMAIDIFNWLTGDEADTKISNANTTMKSYVDLLNASGLIKNWNATGLIANWSIADLNATGLVKDWNATGLIKTWTDTDTFVGNYSTFLNHITWANVYNGTMAKTSDLINYNSSGLIKDWNSTGYIKDWNVTGLIANWSIDTSSFLTSESDPKWTANYSDYLTLFNWNKTYADNLYYGISNPFAFYNVTTAPIYLNDTFRNNYSDYLTIRSYALNDTNYNSSGLIKDWNSTGYIQNWSAIISGSEPFWNSNYSNFSTIYGYSLNGSNLWNGNYSTFLTHIDWSKVINGTMLSQEDYNSNYSSLMLQSTWNNNYTSNNDAWLNTTNLTYNAYNSTGLIRDWNATGLLANWSIDTSSFLTSESDPYWTANKSLYSTTADILGFGYYNITTAPIYLNDTFRNNYSDYLSYLNYHFNNTFNYYNSTTAPIYINDTFGANYSSYLSSLNYHFNNTFNYYNSTTAPIYLNDTFRQNYSDYLITKEYASNDTNWNASGLIKDWNSSELIIDWNADGYITDWNEEGYIKDWNSTGFIKDWLQDILGFNYYNSTNAPIYINDTFANNYSTYLTLFNWNKTYADTLYFGINNWNATNTSYYLATNPFGFYNITTAPIYINDTFGANYSDYLTLPTWTIAMNGTLMKSADWNSTNTSYYLASNPYGFYNVTTAPIYVNDTFGANYSVYLTKPTWSEVMNGTVTSGFYNVTNAPIYLNDTFRGSNYTTFLTHIDWAKAINGTLMLSANWNATNTSYALDTKVNSLGNWSADKSSYGTWANVMNGTVTAGLINWATAINGTLFTTALFNTNYTANDAAYRSITNTSYYLASNPSGFYNSTNAPIYLNDTFRGTNYTNFLTHITWANAVNGTLFKTADYNTNYTTNHPIYTSWVNNYSDYLTTKDNADNFNANYSTFLTHIDWSKAVNGTLALSSAIPTNNNQLLNGFGYYNSTTLASAETDPKWTANYSTYLTKPTWANVINGTVALQSTVNTNVTTANLHTHKAENITAGTFGTGNYVFDSNVTMDCLLFSTGGKICGV